MWDVSSGGGWCSPTQCMVLVAMLAASALADPSTGQLQAEPREPRLEEIVVRARKRSERLIDTPVAVTAVTRSELDQVGAARLDDIQMLVPVVQFRSSGIAQAQSIFIRGIGQQDEGLAFDQGVGLYLDEIPLSRSIGLLLNLIDVSQIEVLRGPQGSLFGRNSVGGAISVHTVKPTDRVEGSVLVRAGRFNAVDTRATLNVPIDIGWFDGKLFSRFSFASRNSRGYIRNDVRRERFGNLNDIGFLGSLRFVHGPLTIDASGSYERSHRRGVGGQCRVEAGAQPSPLTLEVARVFYPGFEDACASQTPFRVRADANSLADLESYGSWVVSSMDLGSISFFEDLSVRSISSWREQRPRYLVDTDFQEFPMIVSAHIGGPDPFGTDGEPAFARQISQELRLHASALKERVHATLGTFLFWDDARDTNGQSGFRFRADGAMGLANQTTVSTLAVDNYSWALFGQLSLDVTEWAQVTAGLRYTADQKGLGKTEVVPLVDSNPRVDARERNTFRDWTPMAALSLTVPDHLRPAVLDHGLGYVSYSSGFKGGGFNALVGQQAGADSSRLDRFEPESVDAYELGLKSLWLGERVRANLSVFYSDYRDIQVVETRGEGLMFVRFVTNAAAATIHGAEFESVVRLLGRLTVSGAATVLEAEYHSFPMAEDNLGPRSIDRAGQSFPNVPEFRAHMGLYYDATVLPESEVFRGVLTPRVDWYYQSEVHYGGPELRALTQRGYNRFDVRLNYEFWERALTVALWSRNLLDETYFNGGISFANVFGTAARFTAPPRTYGGEVTFRF